MQEDNCIVAEITICTATKRASFLIKDKEREEYSLLPEGDLVKLLPKAFSDSALSSGISLTDIGEVLISGGPGYYTSLRIGEAFAKGLLLGDPIEKLRRADSLEVLAFMTDFDERLITVLRARKDVYHAAIFEKRDGRRVRMTENMLLSESELERWRGVRGVGEGLNYLRERWEMRIDKVNDPDAKAMYKYVHGE